MADLFCAGGRFEIAFRPLRASVDNRQRSGARQDPSPLRKRRLDPPVEARGEVAVRSPGRSSLGWNGLAAAGVNPVDQLRRAANLFEDFFFEAGAFRFEALRLAEDGAGAILLSALQKSHAQVHEIRRGRAEVSGLAEKIDRVDVIAPLEVDPSQSGERKLFQLFRRVSKGELGALTRLVQILIPLREVVR